MRKLTNKRLNLLLIFALLASLVFSLGITTIRASNAYNDPQLYDYPVMSEPPYTLKEIQRDRLTRSYAPLALPSAIDKTNDYPQPGNQGNQNSCTAWAVAYAYKTMQENFDHRWGLTNTSTQFSPSFVYNQINRGIDDGSSISVAMQLLRDKGCCTLADMPYNDKDYKTQPTSAQFTTAYPHRSESYGSLSGTNDLKYSIYNTGGAVIGLPLYPDFYTISPNNQIYDVINGDMTGWHAVCLVGYDDDKKAFKFVNSWGTNWGLSGYGWIAYSLIDDGSVGIYGYTMTDYIEVLKKYGFQFIDNSWYYYKETGPDKGSLLFGWQSIGDQRYYFDPGNAKMRTGACDVGGKYYCFRSANNIPSSGPVGSMCTGFQFIDNSWYYYKETEPDKGTIQFGWQSIGDQRYYFDPGNAKMRTGACDVGGKYYCFRQAYNIPSSGPVGSMCTGFQFVDNSWYYYKETEPDKGTIQFDWQSIGDQRYYFDPGNAKMAIDTMRVIEGKTYIFDNNGRCTNYLNQVDVASLLYIAIIISIQTAIDTSRHCKPFVDLVIQEASLITTYST